MRAVPLIAVLCTGLALGALSLAIIGSGRTRPVLIEETPPLDAAAAAPDIVDLRESRGSILAGSSLALGEDPAEFSAALASQTGIELPATATPENLVALLRRTASDYEGHAQRLEIDSKYAQADQLRQLADDARRLARSLSDGQPAQASLPSTSERR
jgi:hypothetical protein